MEPDLQKLLVRLGYLTAAYKPGELDEATRAALRRFQELHELAPALLRSPALDPAYNPRSFST